MEEGEGGKEKGERRGKYVQSPLFVVTQNRAVMNGHVNILIKKHQGEVRLASLPPIRLE